MPEHEDFKHFKYPVYVYQIVADIWLEKPSNASGLRVHHITNNGYDNRPQNLVWVTEAEHKILHDKENW